MCPSRCSRLKRVGEIEIISDENKCLTVIKDKKCKSRPAPKLNGEAEEGRRHFRV